MTAARLVKIDRNGSKHFEGMIVCDRCGGHGDYAIGWHNGQRRITSVDAGVCHKCFGEGKVFSKWIERTPEYEAKLEAKREVKRQQKAAEIKAKQEAEYAKNYSEYLAKNGFNADGKTFIFLGNTYEVKDQIKALGAKFDSGLGWHIGQKVEGYKFIEATVAEVANVDEWGRIWIIAKKADWDAKKAKASSTSAHQGSVGDKITINATYKNSASYTFRFSEGYWGTATQFIHTLEDDSGNIYTWKTQKPIEKIEDEEYIAVEYGEKITLTGTIKEHSEYMGVAQTVLTRCKIK